MLLLHCCMLNILRYEKIFGEIDEPIASLHDPSSDGIFHSEFIFLFMLYLCEWILLWMLTSLVIWNLNITVSTTLKYCYKKALNWKLKLIGGVMKHFPKKLRVHEIFRCMVSCLLGNEIFFEKNVKPSLSLSPPPFSYILNVHSLT